MAKTVPTIQSIDTLTGLSLLFQRNPQIKPSSFAQLAPGKSDAFQKGLTRMAELARSGTLKENAKSFFESKNDNLTRNIEGQNKNRDEHNRDKQK